MVTGVRWKRRDARRRSSKSPELVVLWRSNRHPWPQVRDVLNSPFIYPTPLLPSVLGLVSTFMTSPQIRFASIRGRTATGDLAASRAGAPATGCHSDASSTRATSLFPRSHRHRSSQFVANGRQAKETQPIR
jgi:hypothetical protein